MYSRRTAQPLGAAERLSVRLARKIPKERHREHMGEQHGNDPLHGITLETILNSLVEHLGWDELGRRIKIRCFNSDPSVQSSLKFLRKTPWARTKVENLYVATQKRNRR